MATEHQIAFLDGIASRLGDARYSDLTLLGSARIFLVHKVIVCPQSNLLSEQVATAYPEGTAATKLQLSPQFDDSTYDQMISFFYTQDYDVESVPLCDTCAAYALCEVCTLHRNLKAFEAHVQVLAAASYFVTPKMATMAETKFQATLTCWSIKRNPDVLFVVVEELYKLPKSQAHVMMNALVDKVVSHIAGLSDNSSFRTALRKSSQHGFAADLLEALMERIAVGHLFGGRYGTEGSNYSGYVEGLDALSESTSRSPDDIPATKALSRRSSSLFLD